VTDRASQQFLAAIQAAPDDDGPRLVYADWLQKHGDVRGEFIATQCTLAVMGEDPDDEARADLQARQWQLFDEHAAAWLAELGLEPNEGVFHRGFVEEVNVSFARWEAAHEQLGQHAVVRELWIFDRPDGSPLGTTASRMLFSWPWLRLLRALNLAGNHLHTESIRMLTQSPYLCNLTRLNLNDNYAWGEASNMIAESPYFANLTWLDLGDNALRDEGVRALAGAQHLTKLRELGLAKNRLKRVPELAQSPCFALLESLDLRKNSLDEDTRALLSRHFGKRVRM
jgi:uncharacterized protein (TIGR02996 family)